MPTVDERLIGVRAKIERAKDHIRDLESRIQVFRQSDPYGVWCDKDTHTGEFVYRIQIRQPMPVVFSTIAGDVAHNLRCALDHLAWQLVIANGSIPDRNTMFPIFDRAPKDGGQFTRKVQGMNPATVDIIRAIQPHESGSPALGMSNELDNFDKHRLLYVMACGFVSISQKLRSPLINQIPGLADALQGMLKDIPDPEPASTSGGVPILQDGAEMLRLAWNDGPPLEMHDNFKFTYSISFAQPEIAHSRAVVPLLSQLAQFVTDVVGEFIRFKCLE